MEENIIFFLIFQGDVFTLQFAYELNPSLLTTVSSKPPKVSKRSVSWPTLGKMIFLQPDVPEDDAAAKRNLLETTTLATTRNLPAYSDKSFGLEKLHIKNQISDNILKAGKILDIPELTPLQKELMTLACSYHVSCH